ncbi:MAG: YIP1 family protein [Pseudomonadota bacterium]
MKPWGDTNVTAEHTMTQGAELLPDITLSDVREAQEPDDSAGMSLSTRILSAWKDMRASTRALIDERPSEARLLFFVLLSDVIFFLARTLSLVVAPATTAQKFLPLEIGLWLIGVFVLRTATLYVFSGAVCGIARMLGGTGSWRDTRTAVFWASLVAAPVGVIGALIGVGLGHLAPHVPVLGSDPFVIAPLVLGPVAFVWFISASVAEAHGARRTSFVFIAFSILAVAVSIAIVALAARL